MWVNMPKVFILGLFLLAGLVFSASPIFAWGGFFAEDDTVNIHAINLVLTDNPDDTVTATVEIKFDMDYQVEKNEVTWLMAFPSAPYDIRLLSSYTPHYFDEWTDYGRLREPHNPCDTVIWTKFGLGSGGPDYTNPVPEDFITVDSDNAEDVIQALRGAGFYVPDSASATIQQDIDNKLIIGAFKLHIENPAQYTHRISFTYASDSLTFPMNLTVINEEEGSIALNTWIFGNEPYIPENYPYTDVDYSDFVIENQLTNKIIYRGPDYLFDREIKNINKSSDESTFILEYATPTDVFSTAYLDEFVSLINRFSYVTSLRTIISTDLSHGDVRFIPAAHLLDAPYEVDLSQYVDTLQYWNCTTRTLELHDYSMELPNVADLNGFDFRYPDDWIDSQFEYNDKIFHIFAPQLGTLNDIYDFFDGIYRFPMIVYVPTYFETYDRGSLRDALAKMTDYHGSVEVIDGLSMREFGFAPLLSDQDNWTHPFVQLSLDDDEYKDELATMGRAIRSLAYYSHPELLHTLALSDYLYSDEIFPPITIGFPDGWIEHMEADNMAVLAPETPSSAEVRLIPIDRSQIDDWDTWINDLALNYNLDESASNKLRNRGRQDSCVEYAQPFLFEGSGQRGYIKVDYEYVIQASANIEEFSEYEEIFLLMIESVSPNSNWCALG